MELINEIVVDVCLYLFCYEFMNERINLKGKTDKQQSIASFLLFHCIDIVHHCNTTSLFLFIEVASLFINISCINSLRLSCSILTICDDLIKKGARLFQNALSTVHLAPVVS